MRYHQILQGGENQKGKGAVSIQDHPCAGGSTSPQATLDRITSVEIPSHLQHQDETFDSDPESIQ